MYHFKGSFNSYSDSEKEGNKSKKEYFTLLFVSENNKICDLNLCIYSAKTTP